MPAEKPRESEAELQEFLSQLERLKRARIHGGGTSSRLSIYDEHSPLFEPQTFHDLRNTAGDPENASGIRNMLAVMAEHCCMRPFVEAEEEAGRITESATLRVGEEEVPYSTSEGWLMRQKDRDLRQALEDERVEVIKRVEPLLKQAHRTAHQRCLELGFADMEQMCSHLRGTDYQALKEGCEALLQETQDVFSDHMRWLAQRRAGLDFRKLKRHDLLYIFASGEYNRMFPRRDAQELLTAVMEEMSLSPREPQDLTLDSHHTEGAPHPPLCLPIKAPEEVVLCCPPGGGFNYYLHLLQELGRALFYSHLDPHLPLRYRWGGEPAIPQAYAFLFGSLLRDPLWLRRHLGIEKEPDLLRHSYLEKLYSMRAQAGRFLYELETLAGDPTTDPSAFRELMHRATGVDYPEARHLMDIPPWFKSASNLLACALETRLRHYLMEEHYEDWFRNPETGEFLKSLWADGFRTGPDGILPGGQGTPSEMTALIEDFLQQLA